MTKPLKRGSDSHTQATGQGAFAEGYAMPQMLEDLRRYQAELEIQNEALRYSQQAAEGASERFSALFSHVPLALMVVDESGLVLQSNAMALQKFRPDETDPPLNFLLPLIDSQHSDVVAQAFLQARLVGSSSCSEILFQTGSGEPFTGDLHIAKIENPTDELAHFICAIIDQGPLLAERYSLLESTEELRQRNEELNQSKIRLAAIINSSLDAILCVDIDGSISVFNPAAVILFQCPVEHAIGSPLERFLPNAIDTLSYTQISTHAQLGEMEARTAEGKVLSVEVNISIDSRAEGNIITIFARDLTSKKRIEAHRNVLEAQLRESQKMQAVGTMAGGIAHDFNNILSAILGNAELAIHDTPADSPARISLTEIEKAGRRARDLVRQILTFSRNDPPNWQPIRLEDVIHETMRLIKVNLPHSIEMRVMIYPGVPSVMADATQIEQALLNLCTNAIQSIGQARGTITIELGNPPLGPNQVERRSSTRGNQVRLAVKDSGAGIEPETLQRIFEPFFTTKPVGEGTGLGLAVVHGIMRTHKGAVGVQSKLGKGSNFTLYFPPIDAEPVPIEIQPKVATNISGQGKHVMYVDDDEALTFLVERVLTRRGFKVTAFTNPHIAVTALRADPQDFHLLVSDYNMPGFCGADLLREAQFIRPGLPMALASGYITPEIEESAKLAGALALIHKPNDVEELCEIVQRLVLDHAQH